jgi:hypothetical protein
VVSVIYFEIVLQNEDLLGKCLAIMTNFKSIFGMEDKVHPIQKKKEIHAIRGLP